MLQTLSYSGVLLMEAIGFGASLYHHSGEEILAPIIVGLLALAPMANRFADRMFSRMPENLFD